MTLKSMTGFARADGSYNGIRWHWEIRTVNGRGLDIRLRMPPGYESLEQEVRKICGKHVVRGNCMISLNTRRESGVGEVRVNEESLVQIANAIKRVKDIVAAGPPTIDGLLGLKGVLEVVEAEENEDEQSERQRLMLEDFCNAIQAIVVSRREEGERLEVSISDQISLIEKLVGEAEVSPSRSADAIKAKLVEQIQRLLDTDIDLDRERLHQEAMLMAAKADIEEELDRLRSHIKAGRLLLEEDNPVGRKLEFLTQEFNREANTICSKSNDNELTRIGLDLKAVIDKMREQVQNIE